MNTYPDPLCAVCHRAPKDISEYVDAAKDEETDVDSYVRKEEGTYNRYSGHFYCTLCYIKIGMPLGEAR